MSKPSALTLFCCLAALPLIGCANGVGPQSQAYPTAASSGERIYTAAPGGPAAILVMLPSPGDVLTADPALWAAQGFDVVTPPPSEIYQLAADREAAFDRLIASAQGMADAPIWLAGSNPAIESAMASMPRSRPRELSGVVVTSMTSGAGTCSERMIYSYPGNGGPPKVSVSKSGNACPSGAPFAAGANPTIAPPVPAAPPRGPHLIEAAAGSTAAPGARKTMVQHIADLIKSTPQS